MEDKKIQIRGIICTLLGGIFWGFSGACGQFLFMQEGVNSSWLTTVRMISAGIILLTYSFIKDRKNITAIWRNGKDALRLVLFAIIGLMFCQYAYLTAISYSNAGTATVLQYLGPLFIMVLVCIKKLKLPEKKEIAAIILAILGTFLLATHGSTQNLVLSREGLIWGILAALGLMLYTLLPSKIISKWGSLVVTGYGMLIGGVFLGILVRAWNIEVSIDIRGMFAVGAIIIVGTVAAFTLYLQGVSDIGAVKASMLASIEPVSAAIFSAVWLGTQFMIIDIAGFVCIMATVFLLTKKEKN